MTTNINTNKNAHWDVADLFVALMLSILSLPVLLLMDIFKDIPKALKLEISLFVTLLTPTMFLLYKYPLTWQDFGFERNKVFIIIAMGFICAFIISPRNFFFQPLITPGEFDVVFTKRQHIFISFALGVFILPVMEEILFRGCIYRIIKNRYNFYLAVGVTCFVFAVGHLDFRSAYTSLVLILGYEYTKCLNTSIFAHILLNYGYFYSLYMNV